jgi:hypothetical protein
MAIYIHQAKVRILSSVVIALNVLVTATLCNAEPSVLAGKAFAMGFSPTGKRRLCTAHTRLGHRRRPRAAKDLKFGQTGGHAPGYRQADVRVSLAASKAASRSANLPFAAPARATMVGAGNVSKK